MQMVCARKAYLARDANTGRRDRAAFECFGMTKWIEFLLAGMILPCPCRITLSILHGRPQISLLLLSTYSPTDSCPGNASETGMLRQQKRLLVCPKPHPDPASLCTRPLQTVACITLHLFLSHLSSRYASPSSLAIVHAKSQSEALLNPPAVCRQ